MIVGDIVVIASRALGGTEQLKTKTDVVRVSTRQIVTRDGSKWYAREFGGRHGEIGGGRVIRRWRPDDDAKLERQKLVDTVYKLVELVGTYDADAKLRLLSDEDLQTLAKIAERLDAALVARNAATAENEDDES